MSWDLDFISEEDFTEHVESTLQNYFKNLKAFDVARFNKNSIDPVKMVFDHALGGLEWKDIVSAEIMRQRDKTINNQIGYFHQNIFKYMCDCIVPPNGKSGGWDVIYSPQGNPYKIDRSNSVGKIYVEVKNKHNTMNAASSTSTYEKMTRQIFNDDDSACFLVEIIAKKSQNIVWEPRVRGKKTSNRRIRRVSIDKFYEIVTGEEDAFYRLCMKLPATIEKVLATSDELDPPEDTVFDELEKLAEKSKAPAGVDPMVAAMFSLGFSHYNGFAESNDNIKHVPNISASSNPSITANKQE